MAHVERIRWLLHVEGKSQRQVAKVLGIPHQTVAKYANPRCPATSGGSQPGSWF